MLAKLGLTSPFNKRKIKELQSSKQMGLPQPQHHQQQQPPALPATPPVSNIPMPKRIPIASGNLSSGLPIYHLNTNSSSESMNRPIKTAYVTNETRINNTSFNLNNSKVTLNTVNTNTGISATGPVVLSCESTSNLESLSSLATTSQMKPTTKLPQFSQQSNLIKDAKRKPTLTKSAKAQIVSQPAQQQTTQSNTQINSTNNANNCNISTQNSKISISKLQPPTMIHSNLQATSLTTDSSDSKTVKKFGLTSIASNSTTRTHSATSSSTSMSSSTTPTSLNTCQSSQTNLLQSKVITNNQASQLVAKKPALSFGIPKLTTKLAASSDAPALTSSSQSAISAATPKPSQLPTNSQIQTSTSQIPSVSCSKIPSIGKLKTPSIQINSSVKTTNVTISSKTTPYAASSLSISPAKTTALTTPLNQRKIISTEDNNNNNTDMRSQAKSTSQQLKLSKNEQLVKQQLVKNTLNEDLKSNDLSDNTKPDHDIENRNYCDYDENDDKILGLDDENLVDDNDEEFQKFLNSDQIDSFNHTNSIQQQINLSRISKRISSNSNDLFIHLDTKPATTISSPSPSSALSLTVSPKLISNNIKLHMSPPPPQQHSPQLPPSYAQNILPSPPLPPPPPPPPAVTQSNPPNLLLLTPTLQQFTPQHQQQQASNLLLKTTTNAVNLNTFGRSNTLDRKLKIPTTSSNQLMLNLNNTNKPANKLANENENINTQQIYSNTLDRNFSQQNQQQQHQRQLINTNQTSYNQSPHRNSLSISLKSPNTPSKMSHHFTTSHLHQSKLNYETIDENGTYLITSSASSNDIISISNNSSNSSSSSSTSSSSSSNSAASTQQLKTELENARNRILTLTNQLNTNGQIVNTLEQSLSSLTFKLQKLSISAQKKDNLIIELKAYIEFLHSKYSKYFDTNDKQTFPLNSLLNRQNSTESINSLNSMFSQRSYQTVATTTTTSAANADADSKSVLSTPKKRTNWLRSSFKKAFNRKSSCSTDTQGSKPPSDLKKCLSDVDENDLAKQRLYDFDEFKQANSSNYGTLISSNGGDFSLPTSPLHQTLLGQFKRTAPVSNNPTSPNQCKTNSIISIGDELEEYQRLLRDKEIKLTDVRLEALATAHQLDQTKEENLKMRIEIEQLRADNIRMQQYLNSFQPSSSVSQPPPVSSSLSSPSPSSSISSSSHNSKINLSLSNSTQHVDMSTNSSSNCSIITNDIIKLNEENSSNNKLKISPSCCNIADQINGDGKRVVVSIYLGESDPLLFDPEDESFQAKQILIGSIGISTKTRWDTLDQMVKTLFKEYLTKLEADELGSLGLSLNSLSSYYVGEMPRPADESLENQKLPDLLPYGYLVGNHTNIIIQLKDVNQNSIDSLCFDTLVPKNVMQRYVSLILDHKNILFCGPTGTSKSYMARKIGEYLVRKHNKDIETSIAYFNAENKTCKDLKQYLFNIIAYEHMALSGDKRASSCSAHSSNEVPHVLILDNLNHIGNISEAFLEFFSPKNAHKKCSYVIGTVNQSDVTSLNLHQNFKWVLCVNHTEPIKNYLYRYLIRRLVDHEIKYQLRSVDLEKIIKWIPKLWQHVNKYIESYNSADLTLGPKLFSTFPMDYKLAQNWFIELWNNHLVPFLIETIKEGLQIYGTKTAWEDPKQWLTETMPWFHDFNVINSLYSIEADAVGIDSMQSDKKSTSTKSDIENELDDDAANEYKCVYTKEKTLNHSNDNDKLLSMLMRLQEATLNQQTKSNCFNLNDLNAKQSASVETTLI